MPKLIQALLTGHHPTVFHPHAAVLVPAVIAAVSDTFYKISSEALVVLQLLVKVLRPLDSSPTTFDFTLYTNNIYQCCFQRLKVCPQPRQKNAMCNQPALLFGSRRKTLIRR